MRFRWRCVGFGTAGPRLAFGLLPALLNLVAFGIALTLPTIESVATERTEAQPGSGRTNPGEAARRSIQSGDRAHGSSETAPLLPSPSLALPRRDPPFAWE